MKFSHCRTYSQSISEYGRGVAGGLIFSLPLLFTMEVWQASFLVAPQRLIAYIFVTFALLLLYNLFAGLRKEAAWLECAIDSVEELGLGIVVAALVLWLFGRFEDAETYEMVVMTLMEAMTVAIGVSVGTAQLGASESDADESESDDSGSETEGDSQQDTGSTDFLSQMAIALCGGVLFVSSVAPTEEILIVAVEATPLKLVMIALISLISGGYVLFFSQFRGAGQFATAKKPVFIFRGVISTYAVALLGATVTLYFFSRFDGQSFQTSLAQVVVAGVPASLGASAGRLLLQVNANAN